MTMTARGEQGHRSTSHGRVFGLDVEAPFLIHGLAPARDPGAARGAARLETTTAPELDGVWPAPEATMLAVHRFTDGRAAVTLERHEDFGLRAFAHGFGTYLVSSDGRRIRCAPPAGIEAWRWQRFLVGQVLPLAALLQGIEVFHASAAVVDGRLLAFAGQCGSGKTSVAFNLAMRGATVFTDDVLAVAGDPPICHPGASGANVRDPALQAFVAQDGNPLGRVVGQEGRRTLRVAFTAERETFALSAFYVLARDSDADRLRFEPLEPRFLLAHTFNVALRTPQRLASQLDLCARMATSSLLARVIVPSSVDAAGLAVALRDHAAASVAA